MPELPEVETVRKVLLEKLINRSIVNIISNYPKMVLEDFEQFKEKLIGKKFKDIIRKGKYLIFVFDDINLISHLRMEGKFFYMEKKDDYNKHIHMIITLDNGHELLYHDTRKFGIMLTKTNEELFTTAPLIQLGEDANSSNLDSNSLYNQLSKKKKTIKEALLDQSILAGIGNIYADEILAYCHINPLKKAANISLEECELIKNASFKILNDAIASKGTTIRSYTSSLNVKGQYQDFLLVHTKKICPYCGDDIKKIKVGGRGTYYCEKCQR